MTRHTTLHSQYPTGAFLDPTDHHFNTYRPHHHLSHHQISPHAQDRNLSGTSQRGYRHDFRSSVDPMSTRHFHSMRNAAAMQQQPATLSSNGTGGSGRKRIPVACGRCRKRKIKCSGDPGDGNGCQNCKAARVSLGECVFSRVNSQNIETGSGTGLHGASHSTPNIHASLSHSQHLARPGSTHSSLPHHLSSNHDPYLTKSLYSDPMRQFNNHLSDPSLGLLPSRNNFVDSMVNSAGELSSASSTASSSDLYSQAPPYPLLNSSDGLESSAHASYQPEPLRSWTSTTRYSPPSPYYTVDSSFPSTTSGPTTRSIPTPASTADYPPNIFPAMSSLSSSLPPNSNSSNPQPPLGSSPPSNRNNDKSLPPLNPHPSTATTPTASSTSSYHNIYKPIATSRASTGNSYGSSNLINQGYNTYPNGLDALGVAAAQGVQQQHQEQQQTQQGQLQQQGEEKVKFEDTPRRLATPVGGLEGQAQQGEGYEAERTVSAGKGY